MVGLENLKKINFMRELPEEVLEQISTVAQLEDFDEETILIRQDQSQHLIYMLISGKIYINCRATSGQALTLDELTPGQTFGLSSLLDSAPSTYTAICAEDCQVITISSEQLLQVAQSDFTTGYHVMRQVVEKFKKRMTRHTRLFMAALAAHPAVRQIKSSS